jgi:hypothetical protein
MHCDFGRRGRRCHLLTLARTAQIEQLQDTAGLFVALGGGWWKDGVAQGAP